MLAKVRGNLFLSVLLLTGVAVVIVGGALTYGLRLPIEATVRKEAVRDIQEDVRPKILKMVGPQDLAQPLSGARYEELDRMVKDYALGPNLIRLKLWNSSGTVVYSTLPSQVGEAYPDNEPLQRALRGGVTWEVGRETESPEERPLGEVMEIYLPLMWEPNGTPAAALEIYLSYAPYARHLSSIRNAIFLAVGIALLFLSVVFYLLYRSGWRSISRERDTATQYLRLAQTLNTTLQAHIARLFDLQRALHSLHERTTQLSATESQQFLHERYAALATQIREVTADADALLGPLFTAAREPSRKE